MLPGLRNGCCGLERVNVMPFPQLANEKFATCTTLLTTFIDPGMDNRVYTSLCSCDKRCGFVVVVEQLWAGFRAWRAEFEITAGLSTQGERYPARYGRHRS